MFGKLSKRIITLALLGLSSFAAHADEELLRPEQAFPVSARAQNANSVSVRFDIVDSYYLYHDKISVSTDTPGVELGELRVPPGKVKTDEFFGEVETHRGKLAMTLPLQQRPAQATTLELQVKSQGCADIGICYPPITQTVSLQLAALSFGATASPAPSGGLDFSQLGRSNDAIPDPAEAFTVTVADGGAGALVIDWDIHPNTYLYKDKFDFELMSGTGQLGAVALPVGKKTHDAYFGDVEVYRDTVSMRLPYSGDVSGAQLKLKYQGCADAGVCYVPQEQTLTLAAKLSPALATQAATPSAAVSESSTGIKAMSEQDRLTAEVRDSNFAWVLLGFFGLGLLLAFTPCVFPMIPILSGIIVGQGESLTTRKAFTLSLVYVLAMALTYTVLGVLIGLSGHNIQAWFQAPWLLYSFAALFVALSFSMFGFYELQMPAALQTRLSKLSNRQHGGDYAGVAIMGFLSALIVGPCVTAPLMAVLVYIAESGDAIKGGIILFTLSMGMGAPLLLIGASAGKLLPRSGSWMDTVKAVFGVLMLGMAIWMLERTLPAAVILALTAALLITSSVYMGALSTPAAGKSGWYQLWRGLGLVLMLYGVLLLVGAASGAKSLLRPLAQLNTPALLGNGEFAAASEQHFKRIDNSAQLDAAVASATAAGKPVLFDFYADWCTSCKEMEAFTFTDATVQTALSDFVMLQVDVTDNNSEHQALLKRFGLFGPPAIIFFDRHGEEQRVSRVVGYVSPAPFADIVRGVL